MRTHVIASCSFLLTAACFTPNESLDRAGSTGQSAQTEGTESGEEDTSATMSPTDDATSGPPPTSASSTTLDSSTMETLDATDSTGSPPAPFCGDGTIDPGEDCDDGQDNGLDRACLPDCNLNVCGDGNLGPDEFCDDGAEDNILAVGACAPDCSTVIEEKEILAELFTTGNLGRNPTAAADSACPTEYKALISVPGQRQATTTGYQADALMDWPLSPYTAYVNEDGELIWITDSVPLLGVREGQPEALLATPLQCSMPVPGSPCLTVLAVTGLRADWRNSPSNCGVWTSDAESLPLQVGSPISHQGFLVEGDETTCDIPYAFSYLYCIQQ